MLVRLENSCILCWNGLPLNLSFTAFDTMIAMICVGNNNHFSCVIPYFVDKAYQQQQRFKEYFVCEPLPDTKGSECVPAKPEQCTLDGYICFQPKQH